MSNFEAKDAPVIVQAFERIYAESVVNLITTIQAQEFAIPITLAQQPDLFDIPGFYQKGEGNFWIAISDSKVIGTIAILDLEERTVALRKMFVDPAYRGSESGTASKLLHTVFEYCRVNKADQIFLGTTAQFLAAHKFYEKNGFVEIKKDDLPASFPILSVDSKFYKINL